METPLLPREGRSSPSEELSFVSTTTYKTEVVARHRADDGHESCLVAAGETFLPKRPSGGGVALAVHARSRFCSDRY